MKQKLSAAAMCLATMLEMSSAYASYPQEYAGFKMKFPDMMRSESVSTANDVVKTPRIQDDERIFILQQELYGSKWTFVMTIDDLITHYNPAKGIKLSLRKPLDTRSIIRVMTGADGQYF